MALITASVDSLVSRSRSDRIVPKLDDNVRWLISYFLVVDCQVVLTGSKQRRHNQLPNGDWVNGSIEVTFHSQLLQLVVGKVKHNFDRLGLFW